MLMNESGSRLAILAIAAVALAACSKKDNYGSDTTAASSTVSGDTSAMAGSSGATSSGTWSDANIVALLDEANMADSSAGAIAVTKGTSSQVRDFGRRMTRDHHTLRAQG